MRWPFNIRDLPGAHRCVRKICQETSEKNLFISEEEIIFVSPKYVIEKSMRRIVTMLFASLFLLTIGPLRAQEAETLVLIETDKGKIKVKLYNDTPLHRDNFIKNVNEHRYDGLLFHRVIKQFMIQPEAFP